MKRLGIIGAGQLGQMLGQAAAKLGIEVTFLDPSPDPPAARTGRVIASPFDNPNGLELLAASSDVITYEFENVPVAAVEAISKVVSVYPPADALRYAQDRLNEKRLFDLLNIPVPAYREINSKSDVENAAKLLGLPLVLKTRTLGYDGKGQAVIRHADDINVAWCALGTAPLIAEQWVNFDYEVSVIGARNSSGQKVVYPLTENRHSGGILRVSRVPCRNEALHEKANEYLTSLLEHLDYVGVLALELFVTGDKLFANEFAPRVHNSGHWTIEGAVTSQFENHLRAVLEMPLRDASANACAGMINLIGSMPSGSGPNTDFHYFLHDYGKAARPERKLGHITLLADDVHARDTRLSELEKKLTE